MEAVSRGSLDVGVLCPPARLPRTVTVSHRIADAFVLVVPRDVQPPPQRAASPLPETADAADGLNPPAEAEVETWAAWALDQTWLMPPPDTRSRTILDDWWRGLKAKPAAAMEIDSFDLMIQLVALGLGVACVPRRAVRAFPRKQQIRTHPLPVPLTRELAVITPARPEQPRHVMRFLENILFS